MQMWKSNQKSEPYLRLIHSHLHANVLLSLCDMSFNIKLGASYEHGTYCTVADYTISTCMKIVGALLTTLPGRAVSMDILLRGR